MFTKIRRTAALLASQPNTAGGAHAAFEPLKPHRHDVRNLDKSQSLNPVVAVIAGCATIAAAVWVVAPAMNALLTLEGRTQGVVVGISVMTIWSALDHLAARFESGLARSLRFLDPYVGRKLRATIEAFRAHG